MLYINEAITAQTLVKLVKSTGIQLEEKSYTSLLVNSAATNIDRHVKSVIIVYVGIM